MLNVWIRIAGSWHRGYLPGEWVWSNRGFWILPASLSRTGTGSDYRRDCWNIMKRSWLSWMSRDCPRTTITPNEWFAPTSSFEKFHSRICLEKGPTPMRCWCRFCKPCAFKIRMWSNFSRPPTYATARKIRSHSYPFSPPAKGLRVNLNILDNQFRTITTNI